MRRVEANTSDLSAKLDRHIFVTSHFLQLLPPVIEVSELGEKGLEDKTRIPVDVEDWTRNAEKLVSSGETLTRAERRFSQLDGDAEEAQVQRFFHKRWDNQEEEYFMR